MLNRNLAIVLLHTSTLDDDVGDGFYDGLLNYTIHNAYIQYTMYYILYVNDRNFWDVIGFTMVVAPREYNYYPFWYPYDSYTCCEGKLAGFELWTICYYFFLELDSEIREKSTRFLRVKVRFDIELLGMLTDYIT